MATSGDPRDRDGNGTITLDKYYDARITYRQLRVAMPLLVIVLAASVIDQIYRTDPDCWLGSISAYYYTPVRAVFVGTLCAIGACLIIYRGRTAREDLILNVPGLLVFVVAFIPTPKKSLVIKPGACEDSNVPTKDQLVAAVDNNIRALLVGLTFAVAVVVLFRVLHVTRSSALPTLLFVVTVGAGWIWFLAAPDNLRAHGHLTAAGFVFIGFVAVIAMHAFHVPWLDPKARVPRQPFRLMYQVVLALLVIGSAVLLVLAWADTFEHTVFWLESLVIVLFGAFWVLQTAESWKDFGSPARSPGAH